MVGGLATIGGALFGALFIEFVPVYASDVNEALAGVIYGGVLIAFMYALPGGVMGALRQIGRRAWPRRRRRRRHRQGRGWQMVETDRRIAWWLVLAGRRSRWR